MYIADKVGFVCVHESLLNRSTAADSGRIRCGRGAASTNFQALFGQSGDGQEAPLPAKGDRIDRADSQTGARADFPEKGTGSVRAHDQALARCAWTARPPAWF